jgi:transcriptional regulator with XRE-family HTH domain
VFQKLSEQEIKRVYLQIGSNVKKYRKEKGYSQLDLSTELGYKSTSPVAMAEIYYKGTHFNIESLANIAKCLGVSFDNLFEGVDAILNK